MPAAKNIPAGYTAAGRLFDDATGSNTATGVPLRWTTPGGGVEKTVILPSGTANVWVTENPSLNAIEEWDIYNFTMDAHPIHLHLVNFEVVKCTLMDGDPSPNGSQRAWETGLKGHGHRISGRDHYHQGPVRHRGPVRVALPYTGARRQRDDATLLCGKRRLRG